MKMLVTKQCISWATKQLKIHAINGLNSSSRSPRKKKRNKITVSENKNISQQLHTQLSLLMQQNQVENQMETQSEPNCKSRKQYKFVNLREFLWVLIGITDTEMNPEKQNLHRISRVVWLCGNGIA